MRKSRDVHRVRCLATVLTAFFVACFLALVLPGVSLAGCGGPESAQPAHHPRGQLPPLAIGDSTMLLSMPGLASRGYAVSAQGCRQFFQALALMGELKARGALPHMVVIALGANGAVTHDDIGVALGLLCCTGKLVLVTPRQLGGAPGENAVIEHQETRRHPKRILLLDWVKDSAGHPDWFQPDGLHLTLPGVAAFTRLLATALPYAYPRHKRHKRKPKIERSVGRSTPAQTPPPPASPLTLSAIPSPVGYVAATISGPPGTSVQLSEQVAGAENPISVVALPASGTATVPRALTWLCGRRVRSLVAATLPPAAPAATTTTVTTPSCSRRLVAAVSRRARVGGTITIRLRDRWGIGGLPLSICVTPPGGRRSCRTRQLTQGQRRRVVHVDASRPGGWRTSVETRYGYKKSAIVWASHPGGRIRLLAAGDSEMQILDGFLAGDLARYRVDVTSDARISTGLTNPSFFNWPGHAAQQAASLRPDVTVFFIGANDGFAVAGSHGRVSCCSPAWSAGYANLVSEMMRIYLRGNAGRVYWFVLPAPRPANFQSVFNAVNAGIRAAAKRFPGRVALIDANAFFTPGNRYRDYMVYGGHGFVIHESDGIHLSTASDAIDATIVTHRLLADRVIR
jgi:lysophospholipase L1-like esterase